MQQASLILAALSGVGRPQAGLRTAPCLYVFVIFVLTVCDRMQS
jgi:hypothetical protein